MMSRRRSTGPAGPSLLKEINRMLILNALRDGEPKSRAGIANSLGLSKPTVSALVAELIEHGFVVESDSPSTTGNPGRRPVLLHISPEMGGIISAKLGVAFVKAAVFNINQVMVSRSMKPIPPRSEAQSAVSHFLDVVRSVVEPAIAESGLTRFSGLGIGIDGTVDPASGVLKGSPYHPAWNGIAVRDVLQREFGVPVFVENGVNVGALGEGYAHRGSARNLVTVNVTHTVTAGLIVDGELYRATTNSVGEIGHVRVTDKQVPCVCGNTGCLTAMASEAAVVRLAEDALRAGNTDTRIAEPTVPAVLKAAAKGDCEAHRILGEVGKYLGFALSGIANFLNPDVIVVDGRIIRESEIVYDAALEAFRSRPLPHFATGVSIVPSTLKGDASLVGASMLVLEQVFAPPVLGPFEIRS